MEAQFYPKQRRKAFLFFLNLTFYCICGSILSISSVQAQLEGTYTIGGEDGQYSTFTTAIQALETEGIAGPVTFKIRPGIYEEQLVLDSTYEQITFEGESGDSTAVVLEYPEGYTLHIAGASNYSFRYMTISGAEGAVRISGKPDARASNLLFESNILSSSGNNPVISSHAEGSGAINNNHVFRNNLISGQGFGFWKDHTPSTAPSSGITLTDNGLELKGNRITASRGISISNQADLIISNNTLTGGEGIRVIHSRNIEEINGNQITLSGSSSTGISLNGSVALGYLPKEIMHNHILAPNGGAGIHFNFGAEISSPVTLVANNMISMKAAGGSAGILINSSGAGINFYHNSIYLYGEDNSGIGLNIPADMGAENISLRNNLLTNEAGGYSIFVEHDAQFGDQQGILSADYNNLHSSGPILAHWQGEDISVLEEWQSLTGFGAHSLSVDPQFESADKLIPANSALEGAGIALEEISTDFFGQLRNNPPDIGAAEFEAEPQEPTEALAGLYTIGGESPDFNSFSQALNALTNQGVSDYVTFKVRPGTYEEQLVINSIPGSSCSHQVNFEGEGAAPAQVVLQSPEGSALTIQVNGVDGIGFRNLSIVRDVEVGPGSDCFVLEDNILQGSVQAISSAQERNNQHLYLNNLFQTGGLIIENEAPWNPDAPIFDEGLAIKGNEFRSSGSAIAISGQQGFTISNNEIPTLSQNGVGIAVNNSWYGEEISGNTILAEVGNYKGTAFLLNSGAAAKITENEIRISEGGIGMDISTGKSLGNEILIANNIVEVRGYDARGHNYFPISNLVGLYISNNYPNTVKIYHNNINVGGYSEWVPNYALSVSGESNSFHILNNVIWNGSYGTGIVVENASSIAAMDYNNLYMSYANFFANWEGQEINSLEEWQNVTGFDAHSISVHPTYPINPNEAMVGAGIYVSEVPRDIYGQERNDPPTIGPVESTFTGTPLSGTYTIGGENPDFANFVEAGEAMNQFGITYKVLFKVRAGEYYGQLNLKGFSEENTSVTFEGESGDSTDVVLQYPLGNVLDLNKSKNFSFRHMTFAAGVYLRNSTSLLFEHNVFVGGVNAYQVNQNTYRNNLFREVGISKHGGGHFEQAGTVLFDTDKEVVIQGNTFEVSGSAIYLSAQKDVIINDNAVSIQEEEESTNQAAITVVYSSDIKEIKNNSITSTQVNTTGFSFEGGYLAAGLPQELSNNRIVLLNGGTGLYFYYTGGSSPAALVANNMISINAINSSTGISVSFLPPGDLHFFHNSVSLYGDDSNSKVMYFGDEIFHEILLQNNIFANLAGGTVFQGDNFGYSPDKISASDYNNLYTTGEILAEWEEGPIPSLSEWQALTGFDEHSLSVDPLFESEVELVPDNPALDGAGITLEAVDTDFYGQLRNDPPDLGAVEFDTAPTEPVAVVPVLECVSRNSDGSYTASFGYNNPNQQPVSIPIGSENRLNLLEYAGQPHSFEPGRHEAVFFVVFERDELTWTLGEDVVVASSETQACPTAIQPVEPMVECVTQLNPYTLIAKMGYYNPNEAPVAIAHGKHNRFISSDNLGQPTVFEPGQHSEAFYVSYAGTQQWRLGMHKLRIARNEASCDQAIQAVQPVLECVSHNSDGSYTAHFGYHNPNPVAVATSHGLHNHLRPDLPGPEGPPSIFEPGRHEYVFSHTFRGSKAQWKLLNTSITATNNPALACDDTEQVASGAQAQGQENIRAYPVPFNKTLQLKITDNTSERVNIRLYSLAGTLLLEDSKPNSLEAISLNLEHLDVGVYILEVKTGSLQKSLRVLKR